MHSVVSENSDNDLIGTILIIPTSSVIIQPRAEATRIMIITMTMLRIACYRFPLVSQRNEIKWVAFLFIIHSLTTKVEVPTN